MLLKNKKPLHVFSLWRHIDHQLLLLVCTVMLIGLILIATAGPASSERIGISGMHFFANQIVYAFLAVFVILFMAALPQRNIEALMYFGFVASLIALCLLPFFGDLNKGARRWINLFGFCVQPSEMIKPFYVFVIAKILTHRSTCYPPVENDTTSSNRQLFRTNPANADIKISPLLRRLSSSSQRHFILCLILHIPIIGLLIIQPDFGMTVTISLVTATQMFIAGLPWLWITLGLCCTAILAYSSYLLLPHVAQRIEIFLKGGEKTGVAYQVEKSLLSYNRGGAFGVGPGEGMVKFQLPDSHTDFIFAVAAEEFGCVLCIGVILLFALIVIKCFNCARTIKNDLAALSIFGITMYIAFQSFFNIGVTLNILPTKGMTLPFISYGGSALISSAIGIGLILNLLAHNAKKSAISNIHVRC